MSEAFYQQALDAQAGDAGARLLLGEWLAARGDGRAGGLRVMAARHRYTVYDGTGWGWCVNRVCWTRPGLFPLCVGHLLPDHASVGVYFDSRRDAEDALCRAIAAGADACAPLA